ncbi:hypothetical protein, partial [Pseudomonas gessardii]|uniref:hypothetical protein n=1 Tax=Pseudomonas gessardii TaxID=78544 RepID=UPI0023DDB723
QAEALGMTNLNGGTLFNAEFGIRHRAAPYRKGQVLHSVFAAANSKKTNYLLLTYSPWNDVIRHPGICLTFLTKFDREHV